MNAEKELKSAIRSGHEERITKAFERLYSERVRFVSRILINSCGNDYEVHDDVEEAFLGLLKEPQRLLTVDQIVEYWVQSAKYICVHRKEKLRRLAQISNDDDIPDQKQSIPDLLQGKDLFDKIEVWLGHPDSEIVIFQAAFDYTQKEVAEMLGMGEDAVGYRYRKAIKELRKRFKDEDKKKE